MQKIVLLCLVLIGNLWAMSGEDVFKAKCASCHKAFVPVDVLMDNFMKQDNQLLKLKAPTVNQISYRIKQQIGDPRGDEDMHRMEVAAFVADYMMYPDKQKSVCMPKILKFFDVMPSMKGVLSLDEIEAVSEYMYEYEDNMKKKHTVKYESFSIAMSRALKENKIILIKATAPHCRYCIKMDREVLASKDVYEILKKDFIVVSVDISKESLPLGLRSSMTPSFFFIFQDKKDNVKTKKIPGAWSKDDFIEILKEAIIANKSTKKEF